MTQSSPIYCFLSKCQQLLGLGLAEARSWELIPDLPCEWQRPNHLSLHLQPPRVSIGRMLELDTEAKT